MGRTTLNAERFLLPISGDELSFREAPWNQNLTGGNCYSFSLNTYKASATEKPQPGDIAVIYSDMHEPYKLLEPFDLTKCTTLQRRVMADGIAMKRITDKSKDGQPFDHLKTVIQIGKMQSRPPRGTYKIAAVIDRGNDYHFFRQDVLDIYNIYTCPIYVYKNQNTFSAPKNPYQVLQIDAFTSGNAIMDMYDTKKRYDEATRDAFKKLTRDFGPAFEGAPAYLNRAITNITIHVRRLPRYVIDEGDLLVDPFWLLDTPDDGTGLRKKADALYDFFVRTNRQLHAQTVQGALRDCERIVRDPTLAPQKHQLIGLWSQKLGFATPAINTDGFMKLILDPRRAMRRFGQGQNGLKYEVFCTAFYVDRNHGITSVPQGLTEFGLA